MKRWTIVLSIIITAMILIPGLIFAAEKLVFGLSISTQVNPFYKAMADGMKDQAKKMGLEAARGILLGFAIQFLEAGISLND